jgi:hypothetical protein
MNANATIWKTGYMPLIIGGIGAMGSALFMPWVIIASPVAGRISRTGLNTHDGKFFAFAVVVLAVLAHFEARTPRVTTRFALLVGGVTVAVAAVVEYRDLSNVVVAINSDLGQAQLGFGIFALGLGLTFLIAGTVKRRLLLGNEDGVRADRGEGLDQAA